MRPIVVLGAGSWGTALAIQFARGGGPTVLWGRAEDEPEKIARERENVRYLPGAKFPQALAIETRVNGQVRQRASTGDMIFTLAETIEWISRFLTLEPGDLIATGTPSGVGSTTGTFLQAGDVVEVEVERLGVLRNRVMGVG